MPLTCITGRAGAGKTARCLAITRECLARKQRVIWLVPEQDTVRAERMIASALHLQVLWDLEVLSPTRLVRRVQEQAGGSARVWLSDAGRAMALRGAMLGCRDAMRVFRSGSQGAADLMGDFLVELKRGEADPTALRLCADELPADSALAHKLYDLSAIYEAYDAHLQGKYIDGEDALQWCARHIPQCDDLTDAVVLCDGFDVLPRTTLRLLSALAAKCAQVCVSFSVCPPRDSDASLYEQSRLSMHTLTEMCAELGVPCAVEELEERPLANEELQHLARNLYADRAKKYEKAPQRVRIAQCRDPYMEAERAAGYLFEKCRTEGWRYRDMAVVCNDMDTYAERLRLAFARRGMRVYIDRAPTADQHPLAQYLLSALAGAARYYRIDDMLRCLKSGYCDLTAREADRLELYAMEHGLEGKLWERPIEENEAVSEDEDKTRIRTLEEIRARFVAPLSAFRQNGLTRSVEQFARDTVQLMEAACVTDQLAREYKKYEEQDDAVRMQIVRQMQDAVNSVLDQAVELCGSEEMRTQDFIKLLKSGLSAVTLGSIPMSPDAVYVGEITRFKGHNVKLLYVVGANADVIPARKSDNGLLAENEKVLLRQAAEKAGADIRLNLLSNRAAVERFAIFGALISPSEELVFSWASVDARGAARRESPLLVRLKQKVFPLLREECGVTGDAYVYAGARASVREALAAGLRGEEWDDQLEQLFGAYAAVYPDDARQLLRALSYDSAEQEIDEHTAAQLYKRWEKQKKYGVDGLVAGISQLETFALCPFAHYVRYGLRPQEMEQPDMDVRERGTMEHRAVERFMGSLSKLDKNFSDEQVQSLMDEALAPLFREDAQKRPHRTGLTRAGHSQIRRTMQRMGKLLAMQQRLSDFQVSAEEIAFAPGDLPPLTLRDGETVHLEGKIDRVDVKRLKGEEYARVIDYKTGNNTLSLDDVYYGLRLQLFLYLDAVLSMRGAKPAGVFYQKLGDAKVSLEGSMPDEKAAAKRNKKFKLSGYILENEDVIGSMCSDPDWMDQVLPISPKKSKGKAIKGQFTDSSREKMLTEQQFEQLRGHTRRKLTALAQQMLDGAAQASPAKTTDIDACKYCAYASVCGFDESLPNCKRRNLKMDAETVMQHIAEEGEHA